MRISHVESRLEQQTTLIDLIANAMDNLIKVGVTNITPQRVHARLTSLKENWEKFSLVNDAIGLSVSELSPEDRLQIQKHSYFSENLFSMTHECYLKAIEKMTSFLEHEHEIKQKTPTSSTSSIQDNSQNSSFPTFFHHVRLPRIDIRIEI